MILATQDQVYRALRQRLVDSLDLPESRVYLTQEPKFTEAMDFAVQISPIAAGAQNDYNRSGLGFITERFSVTTFVRTASDNDFKQSRQLAGLDHGVLMRQAKIRKVLIQDLLDGLLQVAIRFVSSGPIRQEPRAQLYISSTDVFTCSYATPWPYAGSFKYGFKATQPAWTDLTGVNNYRGKIDLTLTKVRSTSDSEYFWFAFPQELHDLGVQIKTTAGLEPFYRTGFPSDSGPSIGTIVEDGVTYQLYRRAYPTVSSSLTYRIKVT
jgi:hypothetical protein